MVLSTIFWAVPWRIYAGEEVPCIKTDRICKGDPVSAIDWKLSAAGIYGVKSFRCIDPVSGLAVGKFIGPIEMRHSVCKSDAYAVTLSSGKIDYYVTIISDRISSINRSSTVTLP